MKLRIKGNTIRIRLPKSGLEHFIQTGMVEESLNFGPGNVLFYALQKTTGGKNLQAMFENNRITIKIPESIAKQWIETAQVGIDQTIENGIEGGLHILVEKDFQCLHRHKENKADLFPNPKTK